LLSFAIAGFYAGVAGALYAARRGNVVAEDFQFATIALPYLIVAVVGGLRRRGGIVLFAVLFVLGQDWLPHLANTLNVSWIARNAPLLVQALAGVLAILTLIFQPAGLGVVTTPFARWLKGDRLHFALDEGPGAEVADARP
jgi:branched-chain amino acid transport system permease protein